MNTKVRWGTAITALTLMMALGGCALATQDDVAKAREEGAAQASQEASRTAAEEKAKAEQQKLADNAAAAAKAAQEAAKAAQAAATRTAAPSNTGSAQRATSGSGGGTRSCGGNISVNAATSCSFAEVVVSDWYANGGGNASFYSYSPVTNRSYWMTCKSGIPTVCRGGNNAVVYIR